MSNVCRIDPNSVFCQSNLDNRSNSLTWVEQQQQNYVNQQQRSNGISWETVNNVLGTGLDGWAKIVGAKNQSNNNYYTTQGQNGQPVNSKNNTGLYIILGVGLLVVLYFLVIKK